jgi:pimeloyl-ACP methyl ester carboxylesterase
MTNWVVDALTNLKITHAGKYPDLFKKLTPSGNLKDWDRTGELRQIRCKTLIISGEFDESTPAINQVLQQGLTNARAELMPGCSHLCHLENPDAYFEHVQKFLDQINEPKND